MAPQVYLSYRINECASVAIALQEALHAYGVSALVAHLDISPNSSWPVELTKELDQCAVYVILATDSYGAGGQQFLGTMEVRCKL